MNQIPKTFEEWKDCLLHNCRVNLTPEFAQKRLLIYNNSNHNETKKFIKIYGLQHLQLIIKWFKQIENAA